MKNKNLFFVAVLFFAVIFVFKTCRSSDSNNTEKPKVEERSPLTEITTTSQQVDTGLIIFEASISDLEIPFLRSNESVIRHFAYSLCYNELNEQANWVAYLLTRNETKSIYKRSNKFIADPLVKTNSADHRDYSKSGFDRGHLAPAGDMGWSSQAMVESFYYSNMSPQDPSFNRGIWKKMEEMVRSWANEYDSLYIVTGPVLNKALQTIGHNKVAVPDYYFKIVLDNSGADRKSLAFLVPNKGSKESISSYVVSIDKVEEVTGIDFFPLLSDDLENSLESSADKNSWIWKIPKTERNHEKKNVDQENGLKTANSVQCSGTTQKGLRCKNKTLDPSGKCHHHD